MLRAISRLRCIGNMLLPCKSLVDDRVAVVLGSFLTVFFGAVKKTETEKAILSPGHQHIDKLRDIGNALLGVFSL